MGRYEAISFCGACQTQHAFEACCCPVCGSTLGLWNQSYETEPEAAEKWKKAQAGIGQRVVREPAGRQDAKPKAGRLY